MLFVRLPSGKTMPVNPDEDPDGTVAVFRDAAGVWVGRVLNADDKPDAWERLHVTHFATCTAKARSDARAKADARAGVQQPGVAVLADYRAQRAARGLRGRR